MNLLVSLLLTANSVCSASEGAHGHHEGIPTVVWHQAFNVSIIVISLYFVLKPKVREYFSQKRNQFLEAQNKAHMALEKAQKEHNEIKTKLLRLEETQVETLQKAKEDALIFKRQLLGEAEVLAAKLKKEAELAAQNEVYKANKELRETLLEKALELAKKEISSKATVDDQKRLQQDFISKVQVVR